MPWRRWSHLLKDACHLGREPVAVGFLGALPEGAAPPSERLSVCQALRRASEGEALTLTADTCGCPGGLVNLGLGQQTPEGQERLAAFLIGRERVYGSRAALHRGQHTLEPPLGLARHVCFAPLGSATFRPDLVAFVDRPGVLHRLIGLANHWEGGALDTDLSGPACRGGLAYPLLTGRLGLSLLDFGARRLAGFPPEVLLLTVPYARMPGILHALEAGVLPAEDGTAEAMEREFDALGPLARA